MMIYINGSEHQLEGPVSVGVMLEQLQLDTRKIAVERNLAIVPKSQYATTGLTEGDRVEIVNFVGGG